MSTFHAVVWIDHTEAHVVMFDREHVQAQRIQSRSHHKHQGPSDNAPAFFAEVAQALIGTHEVLLTGPGQTRLAFRTWCNEHHKATATTIVESIASDHPSDAQLAAMAKQYFVKFDNMNTPPRG